MPRPARPHGSSGIYHITQRGANRQPLFAASEDCRKFLGILQQCRDISGFSLYAYCLMGNHFHLLLKVGDEPLERVFRRIGVRYVQWFNTKYERTGPLFQNRYHSKAIEDERYFITALRYVYQNPIKAGLCTLPEEYPWSSFRLLGQPDELISQDGITEIIPLDDLRALTHAAIPATDGALSQLAAARLSDAQAAARIHAIAGIEDPQALRLLPTEDQHRCFAALLTEGFSARQLERLTGISRRSNVCRAAIAQQEPSPVGSAQ